MKHPEKLVQKYGAKAGVLMYVAQELPDIPQLPMVVKMPDESIDDFIRRIDAANMGLPILLRSSAVAELYGYEGDFLTEWVDGSEKVYTISEETLEFIKQKIENVENSTKEFKDKPEHSHLPDKINVIAVEQASSRFYGTFIKHPNQDEVYIFSVRKSLSPTLSTFDYAPERGVRETGGDLGKYVKEVEEKLEKILLWYDRIASLPLMDSDWAYQIEFGLAPNYLFQVRPFKPIVKADFEVKRKEEFGDPLVIGVTSKEGIDVRVETGLYDAFMSHEVLNPKNEPSVLVDSLRRMAKHAGLLPNLQANLLYDREGMLTHDDIKAMRRAQVSILYPEQRGSFSFFWKLKQNKWINIVSDGKNIDIRDIEK
jgi:hypothetical protein